MNIVCVTVWPLRDISIYNLLRALIFVWIEGKKWLSKYVTNYSTISIDRIRFNLVSWLSKRSRGLVLHEILLIFRWNMESFHEVSLLDLSVLVLYALLYQTSFTRLKASIIDSVQLYITGLCHTFAFVLHTCFFF